MKVLGKSRQFAVTLAVFLLASFCLYRCSRSIPGGENYDVANAVGKFIDHGYGGFADRTAADHDHRGKIYYVLPRVGNNPVVTFYEIESPEDLAKVEVLARQALVAIPQANSITLKFYETQIFHEIGGRGWETLIKETELRRP